jgi:hypothetical protein
MQMSLPFIQNLHLIRSTTSWDSSLMYDFKTEVVIFGDIAAYQDVASRLRAAAGGNEAIDPCIDTTQSNSMSLVIAAPAKPSGRGACVRLLERAVQLNGAACMELIVYGNCEGYCWLADQFDRLLLHVDDIDFHLHIDDWYLKEIVPRSVSLNIRGPLRVWQLENLDHWRALVTERQDSYLPTHLDPIRERYALPVFGGPPNAMAFELFKEDLI